MQLERLELLIGKEKVDILKQKTILVLGLGGVGGYAVESLVRSGIGKIILVDYDRIDPTNLNRQIVATIESIGEKKTDAWEKRIENISKECIVKKIDKKMTPENIELLFNEKPDFIIDACDTISTKKELIKMCLKKGIPFISSMGTGNKLDPTKLEITDIRKTSYDPIAKIIRKMVKEENLKGKIMTICSTESPQKREGKIASCAFVPSVAGLYATSYAIRYLIKEDL